MKKGTFTLWSPSAIGAIYIGKDKKMYVYDKHYVTDIKTGRKIRVEEAAGRLRKVI
jgi:hypothetical protein